LAIDPSDVYALNNIGSALNSLGNYDGAIQYSDKAVAMDLKNSIALNNIGWALIKLGNYNL
jgi:tetratricopeptide (TPR) repeat protein